jgi:hypothetical protein
VTRPPLRWPQSDLTYGVIEPMKIHRNGPSD